MKCTQCDIPFMTVPYIQQHTVDYCRSCHGMWVHAKTLKKLSQQTKETALISDLTDCFSSVSEETSNQKVTCPTCQSPLTINSNLVNSPIHIQGCSSHGIWLSKEQLMILEQFLQSEKGTDQHKLAFFSSIIE